MSKSSHPPKPLSLTGPLDSLSLSLPSEPPDIRNWFPSYVYESPESNTLIGSQDFDGSGESCLEDGKKGKSGENQPVEKWNNGLIDAGKKSSDGIVKCNESGDIEDNESAKVAGSSEPLSSLSEPPHINNWFSSYIYESSPLDTTHDFSILDFKENEDGELCNNTKKSQDYKTVMNSIDAEESIEVPSQSKIPDVVIKCSNLVKDTKLDHQPLCQDAHNISLRPTPSTLSRLTSEEDSEQILSRQGTGNNSNDSVKKFGNTNKYGREYDMKLDCDSADTTCGKYIKNDQVKDSLEKEDQRRIVSLPKEYSGRSSIERRSINKENMETETLESGFISIRKKSHQANAGNEIRPSRVQFESLKNGVKPLLKKDTIISRRVLSETTTFHSSNILESTTGKWSCPQKNKPNLGPPLKQLRLEQWVRRV